MRLSRPYGRLLSRLLGILAAVLALAAGASASTAIAGPASWQLAPASSAPAGSPLAPVALGHVGEISFWAPNRGLLIEEGSPGTKKCTTSSDTAVVPCGLYAYNGEGWHLLSKVCGAEDGRIAWAGPDEFWTISDQRPGQNTGIESEQTHDVSLCRFQDGEVKNSFATPLGLPDSYRQMHAAGCLSEGEKPSQKNCWFGGELGVSPNTGAFHLHWAAEQLTIVYSPEGHAVHSIALAGESTLLESVELNPPPHDEYVSEDEQHPALVHQIDPHGFTFDFHNVFMADGGCELTPCPPLPSYEGVPPDSLGGLNLGSEYQPAPSPEATPTPQLWGVAGAKERRLAPHPIVLRYSNGEWTQFGGIGGELKKQQEEGQRSSPAGVNSLITGVAAEPGSPAAWVSLDSEDEEAHVDRLEATCKDKSEGGEAACSGANGKGAISNQETLGEKQAVGKLGSAGAIACPARNDCWMATSRGWLFHLTEEPNRPELTQVYNRPGDFYPKDEDANFAEVITSRPPDAGIPQLPSIEPPAEESTALDAKLPAQTTVQAPASRRTKPLVTDVSSRVVQRDMLELSFRLTVRARVQLLAKRKGRRVAQTALHVLKAGKHTLKLRLNPRRWPNALDLKASPLEALPTVAASGPSPSSPNSVAPPVGSNSVST
jgi:hypothetical protein